MLANSMAVLKAYFLAKAALQHDGPILVLTDDAASAHKLENRGPVLS